MNVSTKWLTKFKKKLNKKKIKEIYFERGIFIDDIHAEYILKEFPKIIDPLLKRYIEKEFIKHIALKHLNVKLTDEGAIEKLNQIRAEKENVENYWHELKEHEKQIIRELFKKSKDEINKEYRRIAKRLNLNTSERDNFPAIIGAILLVTSFVGFITSFMPGITGYVTGDFATGFETTGLNTLSTIVWSLSSLFGVTLIYSTFKKEKNEEQDSLPEFYRNNEQSDETIKV